jgi:hypothetical protein
VREAVHGNGFHARVGDDDFFLAERGGVAVEGGLGVGVQEFAQVRKLGEELEGPVVRGGAKVFLRQPGGRAVVEALVDFVFEAFAHGVHERGGLHFQFGGVNDLVVEEAGEEEPEQLGGDGADGGLVRQVLAVEVVDAAFLRVAREQLIGELSDRDVHAGRMTGAGALVE